MRKLSEQQLDALRNAPAIPARDVVARSWWSLTQVIFTLRCGHQLTAHLDDWPNEWPEQMPCVQCLADDHPVAAAPGPAG
jgi:hypothetical protein